ncbi:GPS domain-containing protein, partial [Durusdinium trenchii]
SRESPTAWYLVSTTTTTGPSFAEALQNALDALNAKKLSYLSLLDGLENITGGGLLAQKIDIDPDGTITAAFVMAPPQDDSAVVLGFGDVQVEVPAATLEAFGGPAVAVMGLLAPGGALFDILNSSELQSDVVSLDIFVNGSAIGDLASPIHFTIPAELAGPADPTCAYLDEERQEWSTVGVSLINVTNTSLLCSTTHLSLFGGIMRSIEQALLCSNAAAIFSIEGLRSLTSRLWIFEWAAILNWIMLLVGAGLLGCARVADLRNQDRMDLTRTIASLKANAKHYAQTHDQHAHHGLGHMLEELYDVLDTGPARMIYSQMLRVQTGFGLKALAKIYQKSGHTALHSRAEAFLLDFSTWSCWRKLCFWYSMQCRWISFQHLNARSSSMVRCSVLLGKIYSGWAMSAVFYGSSAISPGEEDGCLPVEGFLDALVRSLVVQIISAFFGALPFVVLVFLFYQLKGVRLSIRTGIFWSCLAIYFLLCIMVVCIFIASTSSSDGTKWFMTSTLGILLSLIRPLVLIFLMWMVVTTAVWIDARRKRFPSSHPQAAYHILPWPSLDSIIAYEVKFASLEVIERKRSSTRKLFIVTIEVGGRPKSRVIFQQKDDAFRVTEESFKATEGHLMLISVYQNKMDKAHLRGQTEIGVNELLVNGLSSKLPLHLDGRSVPMQVSVHVPPPLRPASQVVSSLEDVLVDEVEAGIEEDGLAEAAESPETRVEIAQIDEEILAQTPGSPESFAQEAPVEVLPVSARVSSSTSLPHDRSDESIPAEAAAFRVRGDLLLGSKTWSQSVRQAAQVRAPPTELRRIEEVEELEAEAPASSPRIKPSSLQGSPVPPVPELPPMPAPAPVPTPRITPRDPDTPRRHELLEKVKDSNLRELCSIAEQRQVLAAPARSKGT